MVWKKELKETNWVLAGFVLFITWLLIDVIFLRETLPEFPIKMSYVMAIGIAYLCGLSLFRSKEGEKK